MRTVVVTNAVSNKAIVIARFLKKTYPDIRVVTCDHRRLTTLVHTRYSDHHVIVPGFKADPDGYIKALVGLVQSEKASVLFPVNSSEMRLLMPHKDRFDQALAYLGDGQAFSILDDKSQLQALASSLGVLTPRVYAQTSDVDGPVVVKPVAGSGSKGVQYYQGAHDVQSAPGLMIQQYVSGNGAGYSVFAVNGKIMTGYGHKRLCEFPVTGGSATYRDDFFVPAMREAAEAIMNHTKWSGFAMLEFKWDGRDLYLIEINPRIWGSIHQGLANGVNYFETLLGPSQNAVQPGKPIATYVSPLFYISLIGYFLRGKAGPLFSFMRNLSRNRVDVSFWNDPLGYLSMVIRWP